VAVGVERDPNRRVAECLGHNLRVDTVLEQARRDAVSGIGLGPRYTLTYELTWYRRNSEVAHHRVIQYVFPFAQPRPVSYLPPGQLYLMRYRTEGGWFIALPYLLQVWSALGLPSTIAEATGTTPTPPSQNDWWSRWLMIPVLASALGSLFFAVRRRRRDAASQSAAAVGTLQASPPP
jgi:hypothetical protein